ncbi:MAG TPA: VWA domain-containing protein [Spirochaetota bacterium]|nr:VWA domain-containing protein [Spirochaetota bacterium]
MKKIIPVILILLTSISAYSASIAVVPYRIDPPLENLTGKDYSRLLSLAMLLMKDADVISPEEVEIAMQQTGVKPENPVSGEDLHAIGLKCRADYVLIGTIGKTKGVYRFKNVLFSVRENSVLSRSSNTGENLYSVLHREIKDTFVNFKDKKTGSSTGSADVAFITDMSYSVSAEWDDIRQAIASFSSSLISRYGLDTRIYIIPFSDKRSYESVTVHENSISGLRKRLNSLRPSGNSSIKSLTSMLNYSLSSIKWRRDASKQIIIINNSGLNGIFLAEKYSSAAKRRGIRIHTVSGGRVSSDYSDAERLAGLTGGTNSSISYHQRVHDQNGKKHEIYLQRGRVFHSMTGYNSWRAGVLSSKSSNPKYVIPPSSLDEIYQDKISTWPEKMVKIFSEGTGIQVMEKNPVQSNIEEIFDSMRESLFRSAGEKFYGKALISDGRLSMWVKIRDARLMNRFAEYAGRGYYLKCGFNVRKSSSEAYGVELIPVTADITSDYITDFVKTTLTDIVKNSNYYISKGIGTPPLWFAEIKVDNIESYEPKRDVRD